MKQLFVKLLIGAFMTLAVPMQASATFNFSPSVKSAEVAAPLPGVPDVIIIVQSENRPDGTTVIVTYRRIVLDGKVVSEGIIDIIVVAPKKS